MELARESWTDERLDDLVRHMDEGFARVDREFALLREEMRAGFERADRRLDAAMHELRSEMHTRFDAIDRRFDTLHRSMIFFYGSLVLALIGVIAALV